MAGGAKVVIGADVREVKPAIDSVVRSVEQGATQVNGAFQGWVGNSNAVATATEKLERQLKGFASEQRTQGRMARFYASEVASIIPAAGGAKAALEGLAGVAIEGLAGGVGIGFGLEAVKFGVAVVGQEMKRTEEIAKSLGDAQLAAATIAERGWDRVRGMMEKVTDGTKAFRDALKEAQSQIDASMKAMDAVREKGPGLVAYLRAAFGDPGAMNRWVSDYQAAAAAFEAAASAAANQADIARAVATENQKAAQAAAADRVIAADEEKKRLESAKERKRVEEEIMKARLAWMPLAGPGNAAGEEQFRIEAAAKKTEDQWLPVFGPGNDQGAQQFGDQLQRINSESSQMQEIWSSIGGSVSNAFASIGNAVGGIAGKVLAWLGQMITQAIQLAVAMSAAGSAWTTPLGSLAIGATVAAGLLGLIGSISARADGGPITGMRPYLVGERGPELIVPRSDGTVIPNEQLGGAGGVSITFNAPVDQAWWRANERHIVRTLREAARGGRA